MVQFYKAKKNTPTRQKFAISVEGLDQFGQGVGHYQGKTCFVEGLLPGESGEVAVIDNKRHFIRAKLITLTHTSPERRKPLCPIYSQCGGCQQQHISEALQHSSKAEALLRLLKPVGVEKMDRVIHGQSWHYRRRTRLSLRVDQAGQLVMGFRRKKSSEIIAVKECPVLVHKLNTLLVPLQQCLAQLDAVAQLGHVELVAGDNDKVTVVLRHLRPLSAADLKILEQFSHNHSVSLFLADGQQHTLLSGEMPWYGINQLNLYFNPQGFIQVNAEINQQMIDNAIKWLDIKPTDRILDLFCGVGNFTLPLAKFARSVTGIEGLAELVSKAAYNAQHNGITNVAFYQHDLEQDVSRQSWAKEGFDKVLLDPARAGAAEIMPYICALQPERIVYISCNPATLARDSQLARQLGYRVIKVTMLDMFPHTEHLESMVLFERH
ncbi:23S rRNA (uracil(1939)-C(5))-methyltransferase RlmD [Rosenbergiella australiborealis]|uniref:23S rRNA (uracil(1939)-C(5))-methyltransferase RlmD n=1 Tax=Rosenbergiella australiborealis TaxID=1544696 RepID=A0ABS5T933_9GAMM|nr:23S rRNA (uracil(1939)-C(5))-methyltransferase RlmD [Rosenbergiella australiborealis]MBT0727952.1 23S rRNA (uracil(1939)-C(5))-methyltransferase RlmD [Rosenbergiella australiborealis]